MNSFRAFSHIVSWLCVFSRRWKMLAWLQKSLAEMTWPPSERISLTSMSMPTNLSLSSGSSFFTSSEWMKRFSRKAQDLCTSARSWETSETFASVFCQPTTVVSKVARKREANMFCTCTWCSSSISTLSSGSFMRKISWLPLCDSKTKSTMVHSPSSFLIVISILFSCLAWSAVSSQASEYLWSSRFHISLSRTSLLTVMDFPQRTIS
mmetsp:Transcript_29992/g.89077  ORF Transcript_29992/g.89077 Transcript_29992/m.89077 type:complete len:208 (-) Transcript_29992:2133-2756(-)